MQSRRANRQSPVSYRTSARRGIRIEQRRFSGLRKLTLSSEAPRQLSPILPAAPDATGFFVVPRTYFGHFGGSFLQPILRVLPVSINLKGAVPCEIIELISSVLTVIVLFGSRIFRPITKMMPAP
jgi:hypothetical protein